MELFSIRIQRTFQLVSTVMELVVIEKSAYLRLKQQIEDLSTQIEAVKKKFGSVEKEK